MITKYFSTILLLLIPSALAAERLRVATWNLENYNVIDRMTPDGWRRAAPKAEKQKDALRRVVRALNADLLAVQEVGGPEFVEELRRDLIAEGVTYAHAATLEGPDPHRRVAVFSKKPFTAIRSHARLETGFGIPSPNERVALVNRGLLGVEIRVAGKSVALYVVHLKSRLTRDPRDPRSENERVAEASAVLRRLADDGVGKPETLAILAGDFNDGPNTKSVSGFAPSFVRLEPKDARGETWTYRNDRKGFLNRSDYLFATPAMNACAVRTFLPDSPACIEASDHRPVAADFEIPEKASK